MLSNVMNELLYGINAIRMFIMIVRNKKLMVNHFDKLSEKIDGDPLRSIEMKENIYALAFTLCFNQDELLEIIDNKTDGQKLQKIHDMPLDSNQSEVFLTAIFCAVC